MGINTVVLGLLGVLLVWLSSRAYVRMQSGVPVLDLPWVPTDVRKTKVYVSQTRDAGMYIERQRRSAILSNPTLVPSHKGFTNGVMEYFLTGILIAPPVVVPVCPAEPASVIVSGGDADDEICDIIDAGTAGGIYDVLDFGGAGGTVCDP